MPDTQVLPAYSINIYVGLWDRDRKFQYSASDVYDEVGAYVDEIGQCFTVTPTKFIYKHGKEAGVIVGLISYPRFPKTNKELFDEALVLARRLLIRCNQYRVTMVTPEKSVMISRENIVD